jgi:ubiquinone/menaquinone biosynthesis C-methylase UbiE
MSTSALQQVKERTWFYEFELPDGTKSQSFVPQHLLHIHTARREKLVQIIDRCVSGDYRARAVDLACHEGYFALALAKYFQKVDAFELRPETVKAARLVAEASGITNVTFHEADLQRCPLDKQFEADFVLVYGLIYHVEDPIGLLRQVSRISRKHVLLESQVLPFECAGRVEDGNYRRQRDLQGVFGLVPDDASSREGGASDLALVPSLNTLLFLLRHVGFKEVEVLKSGPNDFEQFNRGHRVVIYGAK